MKKRLLAFFCTLALALGVLSFGAWGSSSSAIYLLAANDKMCDLPNNALPISVNGTIYVPYTLFDKEATGADVGVYYGIRQDRGTILNLYSLNGTLTFNISQNTCVDRDGNALSFRAVIRNNIPYVPAVAVCNFFGLQYSYLSTSDRGILIRICNSSAALSDSVFLASAASAMLSRYNAILQSQEPPATPTPSPTPTATPTPTPTPAVSQPPATHENVRVYLAVNASEATFDLTDSFGSTRVLFLFTVDSLAGQSDLIRRAVGLGHSIGLIVDSETAEEALAELKRGNELLGHIARIRAHIVSAPTALTESLTAEGWSCWVPNVRGSSARALLNELEQQRSVARLTLPPTSYTISQILTRLREENYTVKQPLENNLR